MKMGRRRLYHRSNSKSASWRVPAVIGMAFGVGLLAQAETIVPDPGEMPEALVRLKTEPVPDDPEQLSCRFTPAQLAILEKLNRADVEHLPRLKEIIVPDRWDLRELDYSPLPQRSLWTGRFAKAFVVHQPMQVFGAYEEGTLVRWGPVSSGGARRPTPAGLFHLNWKSKGRHSTVNPDWFLRWYFNFVNEHGISFHEYALPGRPASHGCVRLLGRDGRWLYQWDDEWELGEKGRSIKTAGTPVWILGEYDYQQDVPWRTPEYIVAGGQVFFERHPAPTIPSDSDGSEHAGAPQVVAADSTDRAAQATRDSI